MKTNLAHLQFVVAPANLPFYRELLTFLGWSAIMDTDDVIGYAGSNGASVWFMPNANGATNDYDGAGMNHLAFGAGAQADVDAVAAWLGEKSIPALFETPRHRPEFSGDGATYYQVMFESPDRVLMEVVYTGPKE